MKGLVLSLDRTENKIIKSNYIENSSSNHNNNISENDKDSEVEEDEDEAKEKEILNNIDTSIEQDGCPDETDFNKWSHYSNNNNKIKLQ